MLNLVLALLLSFAVTSAQALEARLVRESLVPDQDDRPDSPQVLVRLSDGGFVAAGPGFALKIDAAGRLVWRYRRAPGQEWLSFTGAAESRNGDILLCAGPAGGSVGMPYVPSNLLRLDAQGVLIASSVLQPMDPPKRGILQVQGCQGWGEDLLVYGRSEVFLREPSQGQLPQVEVRHWIARVDTHGAPRWERKVASILDKSGDTLGGIDSVLRTADDHAYFAARFGSQTQLFGVSSDGEVLKSRALSGRFTWIGGGRSGKDVELIGGSKEAWQTLRLDPQLEALQATPLPASQAFNGRWAFRLPDDSVAVFGEFLTSGGSYSSGYLWFDPQWKLREQHRLVSPPQVETGQLPAVSATADERQFLTAQLLMQASDAPRLGRRLQGLGINFSLFGF